MEMDSPMLPSPVAVGEQCQSAPGKEGEEEDCAACSSSSPEQSGYRPDNEDAGVSATPVRTPEKLDSTPTSTSPLLTPPEMEKAESDDAAARRLLPLPSPQETGDAETGQLTPRPSPAGACPMEIRIGIGGISWGAYGARDQACVRRCPAAPEFIGFGAADTSSGEPCQSTQRKGGEDDPRSAPGKGGEEDCAAFTQTPGSLPEHSGWQDIASHLHAGVSATPVRTPEKVESTPNATPVLTPEMEKAEFDPSATPVLVESTSYKPRKRSTKGATRLKLVKDPKSTPKPIPVSPDTSQKKRKIDFHVVGGATLGTAKRKLNFESPGILSRANLMNNLKRIAQLQNLRDDLNAYIKTKKGTKRKNIPVDLTIVPYQRAPPTDALCCKLVPEGQLVLHNSHKKKLHTKVLGLDERTIQVYDSLCNWEKTYDENFERADIGSGPGWDATRRYFKYLVDIFLAKMNNLFGHIKISQWKGSVIDSVVGTFLTQNVSDNLSSNAFMNLAAKFPTSKRCSIVTKCSDIPSDSYNDYGKNVSQNEEIKGQYGQVYKTIIENLISTIKREEDISGWDSDRFMNLVNDKSGKPIMSERSLRKFIDALKREDTAHWDKLREEACNKGYNNKSGTELCDSVDWEAVRLASFVEVANCIAVRGQHYLLACRIQAFLDRVKEDHGSFDLDWLRDVTPEKAKNYLLSIRGLGDKSVGCICLLSLGHKAFPVDVNIARLVTRMGWVELQPLPNSAEFHLVDLYPIMRDVQKYLWPRLCTLPKETLYELHYRMINFGKTLCTKVNPNCGPCPFNATCKYYNSSFKRASLPCSEQQYENEGGEEQTNMVMSRRLLLSDRSSMSSFEQVCHPKNMTAERKQVQNREPIIEMPQSPEHGEEVPQCPKYGEARNDEDESLQDDLCDIEDIIQGQQYDFKIDLCSKKDLNHNDSWPSSYGKDPSSCGKDLMLINPYHQNKKLKKKCGLRTTHQAYVLPDNHIILKEFEKRVLDDPSPYLLIIHPPFDEHIVKGTILIPCRTATRGNFPLNGSYFQDHEVFADHSSSCSPLTISRESIASLKMRTVYIGSSIHSITKGQTKQDIQDCYQEGHICVRAFDRCTRYPRKVCASLHATGEMKGSAKNSRKRSKT